MKKIILVILIFRILLANDQFNELSSKAGSFSRMGFGAYGMSLGNASSSLTNGYGEVYYNPALSAYSINNKLSFSYSALSLDRKLNFLSFTKVFDKPSNLKKKFKLKTAFSVGIINSGVDNIEERNNDGILTGKFSTSENIFFLNISNQFNDKFTFGLNVKYLYNKLYKDIKADGIGLDLGFLYQINDQINLSYSIVDLNSSYKWDTSPIYKEYGANYEEKFPVLNRFGLSYIYSYDNLEFLALVNYEYSQYTNYLKFGLEADYNKVVKLRFGIDRLNLSSINNPVKVSFGIGIIQNLFNYTVDFNYGYIIEPYSSENIHVIGLNIIL
jgi:hypothetical protein